MNSYSKQQYHTFNTPGQPYHSDAAMYAQAPQNRIHYMPGGPGYSQAPSPNVQNNNSGVEALTRLFGNSVGLQDQRLGHAGKVNGSGAIDSAGLGGMPYNNTYLMLPNGTFVSGVAQPSHYVPSPTAAEFPNYIHASMNAGYPGYSGLSSIAGNNQGYHYAHGYNGDVPDLAAPRRNSWSSNEENGPSTPYNGFPGYLGAQMGVAVTDNSPVLAYPYSTPSPSMPLLKTKNGKYEPVDINALAAQEPAIPRAVPAVFTPPDKNSLERALENKEGITNVYIRGFLPETTDDMLRGYAGRFGEIKSAKSMLDLGTKQCKG